MPQDPCKCDADLVEMAKEARCYAVQRIKDARQACIDQNPTAPEESCSWSALNADLAFLNALDDFIQRCG